MKQLTPQLKNFAIIIIFMLSLLNLGNAQEQIYNIQDLDLLDDFKTSSIGHFLQDSRGVIWIATPKSLVSYDGTRVKNYSTQDGFLDNFIFALKEDNLGNIWVLSGNYDSAVKKTISVFDTHKGFFLKLKDYLVESSSVALEGLNLSNLFNGVNILINRNNSNFQVSELRDKKISNLFTFNIKNRKLSKPTFGWKHSNDSYAVLIAPTHAVHFDDWEFTILNFDKNGNLEGEYKIETPPPTYLEKYLYKTDYSDYIIANKDVKTFAENISNFVSSFDSYTTLLEPGAGYLASLNDSREKILFFDTYNFQSLGELQNPYPQILNSERKSFDHNGGLWFESENTIGRAHYGVSHFRNIFSPNTTVASRKNRGITQRGEDLIFVEGLYLNKHTNGEVGAFDQVVSSYVDNLGITYTGLLMADDRFIGSTEAHGLVEYSFNDDEFNRYAFLDGKTRFIWQSYIDDSGQIWAGSEGLYKKDSEKEKLVLADEGDFDRLSEVVIYHFYNSDEGTWLCTSDGLYLVDLQDQKIHARYNSIEKGEFYLPLEKCLHLLEDEDGIFWIATKGQGLVKWNRPMKEYKSYTKENIGLSHNVVYAVYSDDHGNLWMPSNDGLMMFNKKSEIVSIFLEEHGLPNSEFNTISHFKDSKGHLYFGTITGMISFNPRDIVFHEEKTENLFISSAITTNRKTGEENNVLEKLLEENAIDVNSVNEITEIELSLPNFECKNGVVYSYKLLGKHKTWVFNKDGIVRLADLDFGKYELLLRAKPLASKKWTEYKQHIRVVAHTPIHKQWWFRLLLALLIGALFYFAVKLYTRQLVKKQAELEKIVADRTEEIRYQAEGLKVQAEELKSLDKVKNNFFTNISHELKTPITLILGPLSYILDSSNALTGAEVKKQLIVLERNAKNLQKLVQEILDLSKLEANKIELVEVATNIEEFITYVVSAFDTQFENLGIEYEIHNLIELDTNVLIDREKVEKIINNFISNAIKYSDQNGRISIHVSEQDEELTIAVKDNGRGIHEKDMPYIFDRFFQSKFEDNKMLGGTGIGLALVKDLSEFMNGRVRAASELGKGSTFTFSMPVTKVNYLDSVAIHSTLEYIDESNDDVDVSDFTILIVEDNDDMREFIKELLSKLYNNLLIARNGAEALEILAENNNKIDLVISDVMMPKVNGLELFKHVRESEASSSIPFIVLTALSSERDKLASLLVGVDDYLTKPFSVPELLARVNNLLVNYAYRKQWWAAQNQASMKTSNEDNSGLLPKSQHKNDQDTQFVIDLKNHIEANLNKKELNVDSLAKTFFVSNRTMHRKVKSITGLTPNKLIKEVQLQKARRILENNKTISITEVAYNVGFAQRTTFAIHFKRRFGVVPSKYNRDIDNQIEE